MYETLSVLHLIRQGQWPQPRLYAGSIYKLQLPIFRVSGTSGLQPDRGISPERGAAKGVQLVPVLPEPDHFTSASSSGAHRPLNVSSSTPAPSGHLVRSVFYATPTSLLPAILLPAPAAVSAATVSAAANAAAVSRHSLAFRRPCQEGPQGQPRPSNSGGHM